MPVENANVNFQLFNNINYKSNGTDLIHFVFDNLRKHMTANKYQASHKKNGSRQRKTNYQNSPVATAATESHDRNLKQISKYRRHRQRGKRCSCKSTRNMI